MATAAHYPPPRTQAQAQAFNYPPQSHQPPSHQQPQIQIQQQGRMGPAPPRYPPPGSARSLYPTFLSLTDSVLLQLRWACRGLWDAFRWSVVVGAVASDSEIRANVYKSLLLNSLSLLSIYVFDLLLQPLVQGQQKWFHRNIGWFYQVLWLLPVVGASLYLNGTWCTIIAKRTYLLQHGGRPVAPQPTSYTGMLKALATSAYRVVMVCTSVVVSFALGRIPVLGPVAGFMFLCWVDAYYCFEFVWISRGLSLSSRIRYLEERWAYFFAFGLPSAALCTWGSTLANAALFALIFPAYIIMAMHARPVPSDPYNPMPPPTPISSTSHLPSDPSAPLIRHPSPFIPIRLPIFALVIWLNDIIVKALNFVGGGPIVRHRGAASLSSPSMGSFERSFGSFGRGRRGSDASESAEDGIGVGKIEMDLLGSNSSLKGMGGPTPMGLRTGSGSASGVGSVPRSTSGRVKLGARRKVD